MQQQVPEPEGGSLNLARNRTSQASYRTQLALDRTTLAWIRTTLTMASFGIGLVAFFPKRPRRGTSSMLSSGFLHQTLSM